MKRNLQNYHVRADFWNWRKIGSTDDQLNLIMTILHHLKRTQIEKHELFVAAPVFDGDLLQVPVAEGRLAAVVVEDAHVAQLAEAER